MVASILPFLGFVCGILGDLLEGVSHFSCKTVGAVPYFDCAQHKRACRFGRPQGYAPTHSFGVK
jgi:hypothetical protein